MKRRFIAGAVCPRCEALDRMTIEEGDDGERLRHCVACGFREAMTARTAPRPTAGRFDRPATPGVEPAPRPVRIMPPKGSPKDSS